MEPETNKETVSPTVPAEVNTEVPADAELEVLQSAADLNETKKPTDDHVPLKKYMAEKGARQESDQKVQQLETEITKLKNGMTSMSVGSVTESIRTIASKYKVSEEFLADVMAVAGNSQREKIRQELEQEFKPKLDQLAEESDNTKREQKRRDVEVKYKALFDKTMAEMPEYEGVVNPDTIKKLAFADPSKKISQHIEETYGKVVPTRKTVDAPNNVGKQTSEINYKNPSEQEFEQINADPKAKEEWAKTTEETLRQYL